MRSVWVLIVLAACGSSPPAGGDAGGDGNDGNLDDANEICSGQCKLTNVALMFQTNRTLALSEGAWAESVPNLEIETNDVRCSHASTVGPIDAEQRFYLESRGIPTQIAERLIVLGFFDEVLDQLPVGPLAAELRGAVSAKLDLERTLTEVA